MDKIAIISDIHGNLEALKATLKDIKDRGVTEIYCIGDIIHKGVHSKECINLIKENCKVVLQGNCDDYFTKEHDLSQIDNETEKKRIMWNKEVLDDEDRAYLQSLPLNYEFYISGRLVRIFHATQDNPYEKLGLFDSLKSKYNLFLPSDKTQSQEIADVIVYGHLHTQLLSQTYNRLLINCGSVGNSLDYVRNDEKDGNVLNTTNAQYIIFEGNLGSKEYGPFSYQFIRVPYDIEKELNCGIFNPEEEAYQYELRMGKYRDMQKVYKNFEKNGINIDEI